MRIRAAANLRYRGFITRKMSTYTENMKSHYEKVANIYDQNVTLFNQADWMLHNTIKCFDLSKWVNVHVDNNIPHIIDLGGGCGNVSKALAKLIVPSRVTCVEPYPEMIAKAKEYTEIETLQLGALEFSKLPIKYSHILLKEMIHHVPTANYLELFSGIYEQLQLEGKAVIITRPVVPEIPFFDRARQIWATTQPPSEIMVSAMEKAGLQVELNTIAYPMSVKKNAWIEFMRQRTWSEFSLCTDDELEYGIEEISKLYENEDILRFNDNVIFIIGTKK